MFMAVGITPENHVIWTKNC